MCGGGTFALQDTSGTAWRHFVLTLEVEQLAFAGSGQRCCWPVYSLQGNLALWRISSVGGERLNS